jgi:ankyrin repeat protein
MFAAFEGRTKIAELLLDKGADVNAADMYNRTALMYAATGPFPEMVELLLDHGAEVNRRDQGEGFTALMFAGAEGNTDVVRLLLQHGADPSIKDVDGDTALDFARQNGHAETAKVLAGE